MPGPDSLSRVHPPWLIIAALSLFVLVAHLFTLMGFTLNNANHAPAAAPKVIAQAQLIAAAPKKPAPAPRKKAAAAPAAAATEPGTPLLPTPSDDALAPQTGPPVAESTSAAPSPSAELEAASDTPDVLLARQLPPPALLEYELEGMDRGLHYRASSTLQWQFNERRYDLSLTVQAFLLGSRQWRSTGRLGPDGLLPERLSDKRKSEVAAHFDRVQQQVIFSSNKPTVPLLAGAQDQISLLVQLGGAVNTAPDRFGPGTTLNVQTVTPRSADLWRITLVSEDPLVLQGQSRLTRHWACAPRGPYDSRLEFWTDPALTGLPVRIRITQANGSYIDMRLSDLKDAPPLPAS
jgi:hypothetical protein